MKTLRMALWIAAASVLCGYAQGFRPDPSLSIFSDHKAIRIGDAITVIVLESSEATNEASKTTGRTSNIGVNTTGVIGENSTPTVDLAVGTSSDFEGGGTIKNSGNVKTKISATIDSLVNGNLCISGRRSITINGEEQTVRIKGVVRPSDVRADNSVLSYNISDAEIVFEGNGMIDTNTNPGWITKLFHWLF